MSQNANYRACAAFQNQMPQLIASGENVADHPHCRGCDVCRALLADLETIAEAARRLFPIVEPPDALWLQIELAIEDEDATTRQHSAASADASTAHRL